ncbi:hypothetical protein POM88_047280 [Heracleum sosnowskyi]|uniref:HAT C-terminal dimerisation domain-containing protein n=1 Tax=Heracleum sosnowskyi TaxID=360622 RepID=A0AAD8GT66_9APIA|nr:hypothetical protein POM88_047280 [Heracleum sosnowskyi]
MAVEHRKEKSPLDWWDAYGGRAIELQSFAKRIVGLCCSSSGCERNWSTFEFIHTKKRNRLPRPTIVLSLGTGTISWIQPFSPTETLEGALNLWSTTDTERYGRHEKHLSERISFNDHEHTTCVTKIRQLAIEELKQVIQAKGSTLQSWFVIA